MAIVNDVLVRAREVLNDPHKVRWTDDALMYWLNDALGLLAQSAPNLFSKSSKHTCKAGATQTLSIDRLIRFDSVDGALPCDRTVLDAFLPGWRKAEPGPIQNWMPSPDGPTKFLVYPPSPTGQALDVRYVQAPDLLTNVLFELPVSDDFISPLADYVIGMAEAKDADHVTTGRAQVFMQSFASKIGIRAEAGA